ncbi:MAG: hypothetical protein J6V72_14755 [Kiritimatiellae bacterium]|nr:hypothetical protein [Kiritimatiellia bacterium]
MARNLKSAGRRIIGGIAFSAMAISVSAVLSGCFACSRHVSAVRPDAILPDSGLNRTYRLADLSLTEPSLSADENADKARKYHSEDTKNMFEAVKASLLKNYPGVFSESADAVPLSVHVSWNTSYQGSPIIQSIVTYMVVPEAAEQETLYYVRTSAREGGTTWTEKTSAARFSETWETWLLPIGFIPIPGKSDWSRTFCFLRLGKDSIVSEPSKTINKKSCIRDMVFDPKVDGDVLAATIMRAVNRHYRSAELAAMIRNGGAK